MPDAGCRPAGYAWLVERHRLAVLPHWRWTFIADRHVRQELERDGVQVHVLPPPRAPGDTDVDQLIFALRYDGVSLPICRALFAAADAERLESALTACVRATPTGAYARRAWFLYEALTGRPLPLEDVRQGNYVPLLDPDAHVTGPVRKHRRQRIDVNVLGSLEVCPIVRWTPGTAQANGAALRQRIESAVAGYDDHTIRRAISYLYTRETLASHEIENERPPATRAERFIALLRRAPEVERLTEAVLVELQGALVDPRFADVTWRDTQVYVGESLDLARQRIHYVAPRPGDVPYLMAAFRDLAAALIDADDVEPVLAAAIVSFLFVLIHPFTDGNGRIHRWLIHWALTRRGVVPSGLILPVSAVMLSRRREYDEALETFSVPLGQRVAYEVHPDGSMTVNHHTLDLYRHPDLTAMAEGLWRWLGLAVEEELPAQLAFLVGLDEARRGIREIVDMPDRLVVLFIKLCRQGGGRLSGRKREAHFAMLTDEEIAAMEQVVATHFAGD